MKNKRRRNEIKQASERDKTLENVRESEMKEEEKKNLFEAKAIKHITERHFLRWLYLFCCFILSCCFLSFYFQKRKKDKPREKITGTKKYRSL